MATQTKDKAVNAARIIAGGAENNMGGFECILDFPLTKGKKYEQDERRTDNLYAWYVEKIDKVPIKVKGYKGAKFAQRFRLVYRTLPDHIIMEFVPGLGIMRYVYEHHGTEAFEDLRLVEYGKNQ